MRVREVVTATHNEQPAECASKCKQSASKCKQSASKVQAECKSTYTA